MKEAQLLQLHLEMEDQDLPLKDTATQLVFGSGSPKAKIVVIGEAPGKNEDEQGIPFVGRAGKLLTQLLNGIGLERKDIYITNIVKYRPPNNRNPTNEEITLHSPYLVRQIEIIKPKVVVTLGNFSTKFVLAGFDLSKMKHVEGISALHGKIVEVESENILIQVMPSYHPAAALYNPNLRSTLETDFNYLKEKLVD